MRTRERRRESSTTVWNEMLGNICSRKVIFSAHHRAKHLPGALWRLAARDTERLAMKWLRTYVAERVPERCVVVASQRLQMINARWHKRKHQEAQAEWDGWRQIEAEGETQVKYPHITIADGADNRPVKVLLSSFFAENNLDEGPLLFVPVEKMGLKLICMWPLFKKKKERKGKNIFWQQRAGQRSSGTKWLLATAEQLLIIRHGIFVLPQQSKQHF